MAARARRPPDVPRGTQRFASSARRALPHAGQALGGRASAAHGEEWGFKRTLARGGVRTPPRKGTEPSVFHVEHVGDKHYALNCAVTISCFFAELCFIGRIGNLNLSKTEGTCYVFVHFYSEINIFISNCCTTIGTCVSFLEVFVFWWFPIGCIPI